MVSYTRALESLFGTMWSRYHSGMPRVAIDTVARCSLSEPPLISPMLRTLTRHAGCSVRCPLAWLRLLRALLIVVFDQEAGQSECLIRGKILGLVFVAGENFAHTFPLNPDEICVWICAINFLLGDQLVA